MSDKDKTAIRAREARARAIAGAGGLEAAVESGVLKKRLDITVSEALVLGLIRQGVTRFVTVFGHGSTDVGETLRVYEAAGLVRTLGVRNEIEASHAAAALRWVTGEKAAVITSIGPGALQALAASLMPASNGLGVWYIFGDETTEDEGPNMQQVPKPEQGLFLKLCSTMGRAYSLHAPGALNAALRRGMLAVDDPGFPGPFFLLLPMNIQPAVINRFNIDELPSGPPPVLGPAHGDERYAEAVRRILAAKRVVVRIGGGARGAGPELEEFLELTGAAAVVSPVAIGTIPCSNPRNMTVGGSKGSISGNWAMENADLLVAVGTRFVCQSDCSRTGYPKVRHVVNINVDPHAATHYGRTTALLGDAALTLARLNQELRQAGGKAGDSDWLRECGAKRREWEAFKHARYERPTLFDPAWGREALTQPAAIKAAADFARARGAVSFFDAGDVQANGFQVVEDEKPGQSFSDTGASYMGFAVSAVLAGALASEPFYSLAFTGDGSFTMNPQILIDAAAHGARGCILLLDNRRMAAISGLQTAQYGHDHATADHVPVDYVKWAESVAGVRGFFGGESIDSLLRALEQAFDHPGLSLVHAPVYYGDDPLGGLGAFGRWNVGNWVEATQAMRHDIGL